MEQKKRKHHILTDKRLCKSCGICVIFCPKNVLEMTINNELLIAREDDCIGCKICEIRCPDFAITVEVDKNAE